MNQRQLQVIDYLREENRVLREQLGDRRVRLNDDQRRRLAVRAKALGRKILAEVASIVTPETLLAWHRKLIAQKYDGTAHRARGDRVPPERLQLWWCVWQKRTGTGLSALGESGGARAARRSPTSFHGRPASPARGASQWARPTRAVADRNDRNPRDSAGLAPQTDRSKVRWERQP